MAINSLFQNIANAIRSVNSSSDTYTPEEMPEAIMNLSTGDMLKSEYDPNGTVLDAGGIEAYTAEALAGKADSATTLAGYGITDAYTKTETDTLLSAKANSATTLAGYGISDAYTITQVDTLLNGKADSATTLAGYGITNAYTKTETDTLLDDKADASDLSTLSETVGTNTNNIATLNSNLTTQSASITFSDAIASYNNADLRKCGNVVTFFIDFTVGDTAISPWDTTWCILPSGYYNTSGYLQVVSSCGLFASIGTNYYFLVNRAGKLSNSMTLSANTRYVISGTYII